METLYFTLGIAFVVVTAVAVGAVWAMFKVAKLNSMLDNVYQQFDSTHRDITMVEQTIFNSIDNNIRHTDEQFKDVYQTTDRISNEMNQRTDDLHLEQSHRIEELNRYIDSRIDKLASKQEKQLIKG
tara:strand:+ start:668 stop:1048 length:381 start_codon:yes stop_codon:yes gene_type:complete